MKNRRSSAREEAEDLFHEAVLEFERLGTQTSGRWSGELLEMFVEPIEGMRVGSSDIRVEIEIGANQLLGSAEASLRVRRRWNQLVSIGWREPGP